MKVLIIYEREKQNTLNNTIKIVANTLKELHVEVEEVLLDEYNIPYYYGEIQKDIQQILEKVKEADAVIFGLKAILMTISGRFKVLFEHFSNPAYKNILEGKYGFCIAITNTGGERESAEYILRTWESLGGLEGGRISFYATEAKEIENIKEVIEKRVEDFYRIFRQARQKLPSSDDPFYVKKELLQSPKEEPKIPSEKKITSWTPPGITEPKPNESAVEPIEIKPAKFERFSEQQEKDIKDLTEFFKQQLSTNNNEPNLNTNPFTPYEKPKMTPIIQNKKSCKQMTQNLPHYFQPHLAANFKGTFQFNVSGEENFESYITINEGECTYFDGVNEQADIVMVMNEDIWLDILKGKLSAQKGFMTGQLKVRGNFMILNKLDQLFKKMQ